VPLRLFPLEVAPMASRAQAARADAMRAGRRIGTVFQTIDKGVEGPDSGGLERCEAGNLRETRMGAQVVGPRRETFLVEEQHQQEGAEHTHRVVGRPRGPGA
jgi:hypothetical protein